MDYLGPNREWFLLKTVAPGNAYRLGNANHLRIIRYLADDAGQRF